jgi:hypothetical protein
VWLDNNFKLISTDEGKTWALYDVSKDKAEANNLASQYSSKVNAMKKDLYAWLDSVSKSASGADYKRIIRNSSK